MPVYGSASDQDLKRTIHACGLLQTTNGGNTWGDFPGLPAAPPRHWRCFGQLVRVRGASGPAPTRRPVAGNPLSAAAEPSGERSNVNQRGFRVHCQGFADFGATTRAECGAYQDQLIPGAWSEPAMAGTENVCANTNWCVWGSMDLLASRNGFQNFYQTVRLTTRQWTRGMSNRPNETLVTAGSAVSHQRMAFCAVWVPLCPVNG